MENAIKIINNIPSSKAGIKLFADAIITGVMDGVEDPLDVKIKLDAIERIIKEIKANADFQAAVLDQADMWVEKTFDFKGAVFTKSESARYDYSADPVYKELDTEKGLVVAKMKARELMLKSLKDSAVIDGIQCYPPVKRSTSVVKISFK